MPDYVPRARGPAGAEAARQLREEREAATRSSRRPEPIRDIPPHMEREIRNNERSTQRSNLWRYQNVKDPERIDTQEPITAKPAWRKLMEETPSAPPTYERQRRPYRWTGDPTRPTQSTSAIPQASGAPPPPPPGDNEDDNGEPWDNRPCPLWWWQWRLWRWKGRIGRWWR